MFDLSYDPPTTDVKLKTVRRRGVYVWAVGGAAVAGALALSYLWQYVEILELNYGVAHRQRELEKAYEENVALKADLYRRRSIGEIDVLARQKLGMHAPAAGQIIVVEEKP